MPQSQPAWSSEILQRVTSTIFHVISVVPLFKSAERVGLRITRRKVKELSLSDTPSHDINDPIMRCLNPRHMRIYAVDEVIIALEDIANGLLSMNGSHYLSVYA